MASCKFEILVSAYLDRELSAEERELFERHVESCPTCRELIAQWREVEQALRRQRLRQALRDEGRTTEHVLRELSRSGEFRRARRKSAWRHARDHLAARWRAYAAGLGLALVVVLVGWGLSSLWRPSGKAGGGTPGARASSVPLALSEVLGQARGIFEELVGPAGVEPGTGKRLQARVVESDLASHLAWERSRLAADGQLRQRLSRVETALVLLANLPAERSDAEAETLAEAVRRSKLLDEIERLRLMTASEAY